MGLRRKKDGMAVIKENVDKFQSIVDGLDNGICLCEDEMSANEKTIQDLTDKNGAIEKSKTQAVVFQGNLKNMLEVPEEEEKKED